MDDPPTVILYDLIGQHGAHFSPNSWRVRMALAHKGLPFEARDVLFTQIADIAPGSRLTIPAIEHGGQVLADSWAIVRHLDDAFEAPRLIPPGDGGQAMRFFQHWAQATIQAGIASLILLDVHDLLQPADQAYFRASREKTFGRPLEAVQAGREARVEPFRKSLQPLRSALAEGAFVGGQAPCYADYLAFGGLQWARVSSTFEVIAPDDPIAAWFERCLDLHGGIGRREPSAADRQARAATP